MNKKVLFFVLCLLLMNSCFLNTDNNGSNHIASLDATGYKMLFGSTKRVFAHYQRNEGATGIDKKYFSGDDLIVHYSAIEIRNDDIQTRYTVTGFGEDEQWLTDDDIISELSKVETSNDGKKTDTLFISAGIDAEWLTEDDEIFSYTVMIPTLYENGEREEKTFHYSGAGKDAQWYTDDDVLADYEVIKFGNADQLIEWSFGFSEGEDGIMNTSDDVASEYSFRNQILSENPETEIQSILRTHAGIDGIYNTNDDTSQMTTRQSIKVKLSAFGYEPLHIFEKLYQYYDDPGLDGEWATDDDILGSKATTEILDEQPSGFSRLNINWASGANEFLGDTDDVVESYHKEIVSIDEEKSISTTVYYNNKGADAVWFSGDDGIEYSHVHVYLWSTWSKE